MFKDGDVVIRKAIVTDTVFQRTGICKHGIYTVDKAYNDSFTLKESLEPTFTFNARYFELTLCGSVSDDPWSYARAKCLRQEAVRAVTAYNEYIQKQPRLEPINIK